MSAETISGSSAGDGGSGRSVALWRAAVVGAAVGASAVPAGTAEAGVIAVGNPVFGNTCTNVGGVLASGGTVSAQGTGTANHIQLPLSLPRNRCGNSGIICNVIFLPSS
ncbi:hypothetical protein [Streptomyces atroolivaceus]|uniref:hypothetical protein n=1 Tax=Streptomyces atroolivaceus TaxID=66869 RepID=UPI0036373CB0